MRGYAMAELHAELAVTGSYLRRENISKYRPQETLKKL